MREKTLEKLERFEKRSEKGVGKSLKSKETKKLKIN